MGDLAGSPRNHRDGNCDLSFSPALAIDKMPMKMEMGSLTISRCANNFDG
jgi:hypothetical protein